MVMPMRFSSDFSWFSWCGCHWPSSALAVDNAPSKATGKTIDLNKMGSPGEKSASGEYSADGYGRKCFFAARIDAPAVSYKLAASGKANPVRHRFPAHSMS
jgi:hypothetical protein